MLDVNDLQNYWYIACESRELRNRPIARQVLGRPVVLFRDRNSQATALIDRCPHRNVPLSLGWVRDGHLVCRYHGWQFDRDGQCRWIPGRCEPGAGRQYAATAVTVVEQQGWVWLTFKVNGVAEGSEKPPNIPLWGEAGVGTWRWQMVERVSVANAAENLLDALHTHFVHTGLIRREGQRQKVQVRVTRSAEQVEARYEGEQAISGLIYRVLGVGMAAASQPLVSIGRFWVPGIAQLEYRVDERNQLFVTLGLTPTGDGWLRGYGVVTFRWRWPTGLGVALAKPLLALATWQDQRILRQQARNLDRFGEERFVSTELDVMRSHITTLLTAAQQGQAAPPLEITVELWV